MENDYDELPEAETVYVSPFAVLFGEAWTGIFSNEEEVEDVR